MDFVENKASEGKDMNIARIILVMIILYYGYKLINNILDTPIVYRRKRFEKEEFDIYLKLLFIRGYVRYGDYNGRMYIESMDRKGRKIIVRKYDFRNEYGMCIYIPEYEKNIEEKVKNYLQENEIEEEVWREWRREIDMKVVGVDLGDDIDTGLKIVEYAINLILKDENEKGRLKVYFKYIAQAEEHYDFFIEQFEKDAEKIKSIDRPTNWMGRIFSGQRKQKL